MGPMDVEFAFQQGGNSLQLLQARPITTLFDIDEDMMTSPGEKRILYYDFNIASEATTTTPFTHMDMQLYICKFDDGMQASLLLRYIYFAGLLPYVMK